MSNKTIAPVAKVLELTIKELLEEFASGHLSVESYIRTLINQYKANTDLNALISFNEAQLIEDARQADLRWSACDNPGRLNGIPFIVKDNYNTVDYDTTAGTPALIGNRAVANAPVVQALLNEGAIIFGKANMHELALGITSNNSRFGAVHNPYDKDMIAGGSSGGTAAGIAARIAPVGLGTDTGGSNRIPEALCGIVGLRPTKGRYSIEGIVPLSHIRDTGGPQARSVDDLNIIDDVITGSGHGNGLAPKNLRKVRLGVDLANYFTNSDADQRAAVLNALTVLENAGATLVPIDMTNVIQLDQIVSFTVVFHEILTDLPVYLATYTNGITIGQLTSQLASPDVAGIMSGLVSGAIPTPDGPYNDAINIYRPQLRSALSALYRTNNLDGIIFPTTPLPARPIGQDATVNLNGQQVPTFNTYIANVDPASNAGFPGVTIPIGLTATGLPIGLEIDGPENSDKQLLSIAKSMTKLFPALPKPTDIVYTSA